MGLFDAFSCFILQSSVPTVLLCFTHVSACMKFMVHSFDMLRDRGITPTLFAACQRLAAGTEEDMTQARPTPIQAECWGLLLSSSASDDAGGNTAMHAATPPPFDLHACKGIHDSERLAAENLAVPSDDSDLEDEKPVRRSASCSTSCRIRESHDLIGICCPLR